MTVRNIRKALGLLVIDIVIIIGIFVLQFRTDSSIIEKIGNLQLTLMKTEESQDAQNSTEKLPVLQNKLQASYNGLNFTIDEQKSAKISLRNKKEEAPVDLIDWEKTDNSVTLKFTNDVSLNFSLTGKDENSPLSVSAKLPRSVKALYVPYNFAYNMKIQKDEGNHVILDGKKLSWNFKTEQVEDGYIVFDSDAVALYSVYDTTKKFTFDSITELASAEASALDSTVTAISNNLISAFKTALAENNFTEQAAVSYVAAMAQNGKFQQAVEDIPQSYKKSSSRTYLSAPYFNSLAAMNKILDAKIAENNALIKRSAESGSLDIFTTHNIAEHLIVYPDSSVVTKLLENAAAANIEDLSISHITGILQAFVGLSSTNTEYAKILAPVMSQCMEKITASCSYANDILTISENDTFLSVVQAVETGIAVLRYGEISGNQTYTKAGRVLVNSYLQDGGSSFDLRTLSNLYPLLAYKNDYYPHLAMINQTKDNKLWAWTCAKKITYEKDDENGLTLTIDFPEGYTHYVIFKGVPKFKSIYIYNMAFRTDPRFEAYNSSGYIYRSDSETLLLKSRHKSRYEPIRMTYTEKTETKDAIPVPTASKSSITATGAAPAATNITAPVTPAVTAPSEEKPVTEEAAPAVTEEPAVKTYSVIVTEILDSRAAVPAIASITNIPPQMYSVIGQKISKLPYTVISDVDEATADDIIERLKATCVVTKQ